MKQDTSAAEPTDQVRRAQQLVDMASFVRGLSDEAAQALQYVNTTLNVYVGGVVAAQHEEASIVVMARWMEEAEAYGARVSRFVSGDYANLVVHFDVAEFHIYAPTTEVLSFPAEDAPGVWPAEFAHLPVHELHRGRPGNES